MSLSPFVFVGLGGSGGKTLRALRQALRSQLDDVGWERDWPLAWQFVHIDVAAEPDGISHDLPLTLPRTDFVPLTTKDSVYVAVDGAVGRTKRQGLDHYLAWDSWRPNPPEHVDVNISLGAGQFRAIGRVALLGDLAHVARELKAALAEAKRPEAKAQLNQIQAMLGAPASGADRAPRFFLIASIAGGSGSGALLDVCDVIRGARDNENQESSAIVFTPEIFERQDGTLDPGIAPNSFVAINELLNASWVRDASSVPLSRDVHFQRAGISVDRTGSGPDSVFLVGRRNTTVVLDNTVEIYRVVGRSLASLALSEELQDGLTAYAAGNRAQLAAGIEHNVPIAADNGPVATNLFAMGFARLTMGRELFRDYAAQRLARAAALRLLDAHLRPGDPRDDETQLREAVDLQWPAFVRDSGLNEVGPEHNDVVNALSDTALLGGLLHGWVEPTRTHIVESAAGRNLRVGDARELVKSAVVEALHKTPRSVAGVEVSGPWLEYRNKALDTVRTWRTDLHAQLAGLVLRTAARQGLPATEALLARLGDDVAKAAMELETEAGQYRNQAAQQLAALSSPRADEPGKVGLGPGEELETILRVDALPVLQYFLHAEVVTIAARALKELPKALIGPLRQSVADADGLLRLEARSGSESMLDAWPRGEGVPVHLTPSSIEFTLDEVADFPSTFDRLVQQSVRDEETTGGAFQRAVTEVLEGRRPARNSQTKDSAKAPFEFSSTWVPRDEQLRGPEEQERTAVAKLSSSLTDLLERARLWSIDDQKAIGRYGRESLLDYLTDISVGAGELARRKIRLVEQFEAMLRVSMPLVKIDSKLLIQAHGIPEPHFAAQLSPLGVPTHDADLVQKLKDAVALVLGSRTTVPFGGTRSQGMQALTTLREPLHPVVFSSLIEPIQTQWAARAGASNFWWRRRSRPLTEWTPVSPEGQAALVEGWLVGRLLGRARFIKADFAARQPAYLQVYVDPGRGPAAWVALPSTGVRRFHPDDAIGNLLELAAIANLDIYQQASLKPLAPFRALAELVASGSGSDHAVDTRHALESWIEDGGSLGADGALANKGGANATTLEERRAVALDVLGAWQRSYSGDAHLWDTDRSIGSLQEMARIEVNRLTMAALDRLIALAGSFAADEVER